MSNLRSAESLEADSTPIQASTLENPSRHSFTVRITHWIVTLCFFALLISGIEITISHPRFYWGETGTVLTEPIFRLPIPASRRLVPSGYGYILPDQNGWSRSLHFQAAWFLVFTGLVYVVTGFFSRHFPKNLIPPRCELSWREASRVVAKHLRFVPSHDEEAWSYNVLQKTAYLFVIFAFFPLVIWTGLAMSPAFNSAFPATVNLLGGRQSARTLHFLVSLVLLLFVVLHVTLVWRTGFASRMRAMITGQKTSSEESAHD
jgi:thiosulfate reductase cytochrome b subunit